MAVTFWFINRTLLQLCWLLDDWRATLATSFFYQFYHFFSSEFISVEVIRATGMLALVLAITGYMILPFFNTRVPLNVVQIAAIMLLAPVILDSGAALFRSLDRGRSALTEDMAARVSGFVSNTPAVAGSDDLALTQPPQLYFSDACGLPMPRHSGGHYGQGIYRLDEIAAGYYFADTVDVHCANSRPNAQNLRLPYAYYDQSVTGYAVVGGLAHSFLPWSRTAQVERTFIGARRMVLGFFPTVMAVAYYTIQLLFTLILVLIWLTIPLSLLLGMFSHDLSWLFAFCRRLWGIIQLNIVLSLVIGMLLMACYSAVRAANAGMLLGVSFFSLWVMLRIVGMVWELLWRTFDTALATVTTAAGFGYGEREIVAALGSQALGNAAQSGWRATQTAANGALFVASKGTLVSVGRTGRWQNKARPPSRATTSSQAPNNLQAGAQARANYRRAAAQMRTNEPHKG